MDHAAANNRELVALTIRSLEEAFARGDDTEAVSALREVFGRRIGACLINVPSPEELKGLPETPAPEQWPGCDVQHLRATKLADHLFEPADCTKGDLARVWFYMHDQHGVVIPDAEWNMFVDWDAADPISTWELERDRRVAAVQGNSNPYVGWFTADESGACSWDPSVE